MAQDTPQAPSADTPESVAARVEEALETCASRPEIAADATGLLSNFIGCVEKGHGSALDAGDGRAARFALDLLERRDRAQAAEIARLADERDRARGEHRTLANLYEVTLPEAREERDGWKARATHAEAQVQAMRDALEHEAARNEVETAMCDRQAEGFKGRNGDRMMRHRCEAAADVHRNTVRRLRAALSTPPTEQPAAADTLMRRVGKSAAGHLLDGVEHRAVPGVSHG